MAKLGEIIFEYSVRNNKKENLPVLSVTNSKGFCSEYFSKEIASKDKSKYKIVPKGYFAYNPSRINVGSIDYQKNYEKVIVSPLYEVFGVTEQVSQQYLLYYLKSDISLTYIKGYAKGSVRDTLKLSELMNFNIPLPPLEEQQKIAAVLDNVTDLIDKRKQQLAKLDELIKSRFVEMFGTFPMNEKNWTVGKIRDVITEAKYGTSRPAVEKGQYPYLRMNNITYSGELDLSDIKQIDIPENELPKCAVRRGDVLFNRTNSKELVGKTCVYDKDEFMVLAGFIIRVRVNEKMLPEFLSEFLNASFSKQMLLGMCKTAIGQANINAQELQNIEIYIPSIDLQQKFVIFKQNMIKTKVAINHSLDKLKTLKKALMQKYFG